MNAPTTGTFFLGVATLLLAAACSTSSPAPDAPARSRSPGAVIGATWEWLGTVTPVEEFRASDPGRYTLRLAPDGTAQLRLDCNRGTGSYEISEGRLSFGPLASTRMACPPGSQDAHYAAYVGRVTSFFLEGSHLYLELPIDSGTMRFRRADED